MNKVVTLHRSKRLSDTEIAVISGFQAAEDALMECKAEGKPIGVVSYEIAAALFEDMTEAPTEYAKAELASFVRRMLEFAGVQE